MLGTEPLETAALSHPLGLDDVGGGHRRVADGADLAAADQVGQGRQRFLDVGVRIGSVDLVEVNPVGLQAPQRVLDLGHDPAPRVAPLVRVIAHRPIDLGREHDVVAAALERLADDHLGLTGRVAVGGVHEVDPGIQRLVDDADAVVVVRITNGGSEHHRAEGIRADADTGVAERAVVQGCAFR